VPKWIRAQDDDAPSVRAVVIRYDPSVADNAELERLLAQIPYGLTNKTWLECLRAGAKAMLRKLYQQSPAQPQATSRAKVPPALAKADVPVSTPAPFPTETPSRRKPEDAATLLSDGRSHETNLTRDEPASSAAPATGFSKAAQRMFDQ
jgi:hypothetical protein